jgi:uncharacterized protein
MAAKPVTLITGAGTGIGAAFAAVFADRGHELVLVSRRLDQLERCADTIAANGRPRPASIAVDLAREDGPARLAAELASRDLEPSIVVNNAGFGLRGEADTLDREQQLGIIDLNIRALTDLSLRWTDSMARHGGGLINVASLAGFFPGPLMAVYYASKAYVTSFTEALHQELLPRGIRVTAVCPGPVATQFHARAGVDDRQLPRKLTRTAARVAGDGYDGFMRNERVVIPGTLNRILAGAPRLLPRAAVLSLASRYQLK